MKKKIDTIEMVRRIRELHSERLKNLTHEEQIAFYREEARKMNERAKEIVHGKPKSESAAIGQES
jgi:hypothetical protein